MTGPTPADLRPGDLMFGPIHGLIPGAFPVGAGQALLSLRKGQQRMRAIPWRTWRTIRHVGVVVEAGNISALSPLRPYPRLVQAMPRGAGEIDLTFASHWTRKYVYVRPRYAAWWPPEEKNPYEPGQARIVAQAARGYLGTPYNFLTYAKLTAGVFRMRATEGLLRRWISTRRDMMCSQLADQALADAGFHVFDDGRLPQDVTPAELFTALLLMPDARYIRPGDADWSRWPD